MLLNLAGEVAGGPTVVVDVPDECGGWDNDCWVDGLMDELVN